MGPDSRQCELLKKSLYVTHDAAENWESSLGGFLEESGMRRGQAITCLIPKRRGESALRSMVMMSLSRLRRKTLSGYEIKTQMVGEVADLDKLLQILNRTVRWSSRGLWIEADRHVREVIKALGHEGASPAPTPGVVAKGDRMQ